MRSSSTRPLPKKDSKESKKSYVSNPSRQVQFGTDFASASSSSSSFGGSRESPPLLAEPVTEDVNESLRHGSLGWQARRTVPIVKNFNRIMAHACTAVLETCHQEIAIMKKICNVKTTDDVNLGHAPLSRIYVSTFRDIEVILKPYEPFLSFHKFTKDVNWLSEVLTCLINNLQTVFYFDNFVEILNDHQMARAEEKALLMFRHFNKKEVKRLRVCVESEGGTWTKVIHILRDNLSNAKNKLNYMVAEYEHKIRYIRDWEQSRREQFHIFLQKQSKNLAEEITHMETETGKETLVHGHVHMYLKENIEENQGKIEKIMAKYDKDVEDKEQQVIKKRDEVDTQRSKYGALLNQYNYRQQQINEYKSHKLVRQKQELVASVIQAWWRKIMVKKGLYKKEKRRKGRGKQGGSTKRGRKK